MLDTESTNEIEWSYNAREFLSKIQQLRKEANLEIEDDVEIFFQADTPLLKSALEKHYDELKDKLKKRFVNATEKPSSYPEVASHAFRFGEETGHIYICKPAISFRKEALTEQLGDAAP